MTFLKLLGLLMARALPGAFMFYGLMYFFLRRRFGIRGGAGPFFKTFVGAWVSVVTVEVVCGLVGYTLTENSGDIIAINLCLSLVWLGIARRLFLDHSELGRVKRVGAEVSPRTYRKGWGYLIAAILCALIALGGVFDPSSTAGTNLTPMTILIGWGSVSGVCVWRWLSANEGR